MDSKNLLTPNRPSELQLFAGIALLLITLKMKIRNRKNAIRPGIEAGPHGKAFDTLRHKTLIQKLDDTGVRGPLLNWCTDYLKDRTFRVKVGNTLSETTEVTDGTAQGSVLGPLHYLAYVKDLNKGHSSKGRKFRSQGCKC
ncbi:reverse transcriptase (RNA-dependent DNA polymerase) domain-containing protein [Phthorimaea operculella]|nr:reverse transcriptase (RNA-dependent DNA polymerase) domain-containing protein [Phthorimaea operculella]